MWVCSAPALGLSGSHGRKETQSARAARTYRLVLGCRVMEMVPIPVVVDTLRVLPAFSDGRPYTERIHTPCRHDIKRVQQCNPG